MGFCWDGISDEIQWFYSLHFACPLSCSALKLTEYRLLSEVTVAEQLEQASQ